MSDIYLKMKTEQQFFLVLVQSSSADKGCETNCLQRNTHKFAYFDTNDTIIPSREVSGPLNYRGGGGRIKTLDLERWWANLLKESLSHSILWYFLLYEIIKNACMNKLKKNSSSPINYSKKFDGL